jgi:hypothetical protein
MCHTPASHWSLLPPTASILCLSRLSSSVALAQLVPRLSSSAPGISTGMLSTCEHFATRAHLLSSVLSHFHISISSVSSRSELHAHCSHARLRSRSVSCRATSSCLRHLWRWRHSSYASTPIGRRYSMPAGRVNTSDAVVLGRPHAHLNAWTHTASSRSSSFSVHGTNAAEYLNAPTPILVKRSIACSGVRG